MLKLRRLEIEKFRSVRPGTVLEFNDGVNVLLGKNGTGKTTLLKLVAAAASGNFAEFREEEFEIRWEMSVGDIELRCAVEHRQSGPLPAFDVSSLPHVPRLGGPVWRSEFALELSRGESHERAIWLDGKLQIEHERGSTEDIAGFPSFVEPSEFSFLQTLVGNLVGLRLTRNAEVQGWLLVLTELDMVARFDESLIWFYRTVVRGGSVEMCRFFVPDGWIVPHARGVPQKFFLRSEASGDRPPEALERRSDQERMLETACRELSFSHCTMRVEFERSEPGSQKFADVRETIFYKGVRFFFTKRDGSRITHEHLSFGQLRLFAFLYYAELHKNSVIVADELTNGLHHSMIELCLETIGERQAFLATQNPLLLDHIGFESAEQVRGTFVLCDLDVADDGRDVMRWHNMSEVQAREFFADYEVGIQHVNDILRTRGLW